MAPGPAFEIFVATPCRGIYIPIVKLEGDVPYCVSEIPQHEDSGFASCGGDDGYIEQLAAVELNAWEQEQGGSGGVFRDDGEDVLSRYGSISRRAGLNRYH